MLWHRLLSWDAEMPALRRLHSHGSDLRGTVPHVFQAESSALTAATLAVAVATFALTAAAHAAVAAAAAALAAAAVALAALLGQHPAIGAPTIAATA